MASEQPPTLINIETKPPNPPSQNPSPKTPLTASEPPPTVITTETKPPRKWAGPGTWGRTLHHLCRPMNAGPLLFTGVCMFLAYRNKAEMAAAMKKALPPARTNALPPARMKAYLQRSVSMAALHGGEKALERIMDSQERMVIGEGGLADAAGNFKTLLKKETRSFNELQRLAGKLEMSGKEDEAVKMLKKALEDERSGSTHMKPMSLKCYWSRCLFTRYRVLLPCSVELNTKINTVFSDPLQIKQRMPNLHMGKYDEALKCQCLDDKELSDARRPLYKAVIHCILGDLDLANDCYKEFQDIRNRFHWPDGIKEGSPLQGAVSDFQVFRRIVNNLKKEIDQAHLEKRSNTA